MLSLYKGSLDGYAAAKSPQENGRRPRESWVIVLWGKGVRPLVPKSGTRGLTPLPHFPFLPGVENCLLNNRASLFKQVHADVERRHNLNDVIVPSHPLDNQCILNST